VCVLLGRRNKNDATNTAAVTTTDVGDDEQEGSEPADSVANDNNVDDYDAGQ